MYIKSNLSQIRTLLLLNWSKVTVKNLQVFFTDLHKHALTRADESETIASYITIESFLNIQSDCLDYYFNFSRKKKVKIFYGENSRFVFA